MNVGVVKSFDRRTGFGVIVPEDGAADVEVHSGAVERAGLARLEVGDRLSFQTTTGGPRGARVATKLRLL